LKLAQTLVLKKVDPPGGLKSGFHNFGVVPAPPGVIPAQAQACACACDLVAVALHFGQNSATEVAALAVSPGVTTAAVTAVAPRPANIQEPMSTVRPLTHTGLGPSAHASSAGFGTSPVGSLNVSGFPPTYA
jgi:hypothetical protein